MAKFGAEKVVICYDDKVNHKHVESLRKALLKLRYGLVLDCNITNTDEFVSMKDSLKTAPAWLWINLFEAESNSSLWQTPAERERLEMPGRSLPIGGTQPPSFPYENSSVSTLDGSYELALGLSETSHNTLDSQGDGNFLRLIRNDWVNINLCKDDDLENSFLQILQFTMDSYRRINPEKMESSNLLNSYIAIESKRKLDGHSPGGSGWLLQCFKRSVEKSLADELGFESDTLDAFNKLLIRIRENTSFDTRVDFFVFVYNLIRSMTMARRLSSWNLEGEKFNCWILMIKTVDDYSKVLNNDMKRVFSASENILFNISFEKQVRELAELGIGDSVFLVVEWSTNRIISVTSHKPENVNSTIRANFNPNNSHVVVHIRPDERVDVLDSAGNVVLNWDGFRWKPNPIAILSNALEPINELDGNVKDTIVNATTKLLNGGYSSIFMIVDSNDVSKCDAVSDKSLRSGLLPPQGLFATIDIKDIGSESLFSLLKLDGAHFIGKNGKILRICGNLKARSDAWHEFSFDSILSAEERLKYDAGFKGNQVAIGKALEKLKVLLCKGAPRMVRYCITVDKNYRVSLSSPVHDDLLPKLAEWLIDDSNNKKFKDLMLQSLGLKKVVKDGRTIVVLSIEIKDTEENFKSNSGTDSAPDQDEFFWFEATAKHRLTTQVSLEKILSIQNKIVSSDWKYAHAVSQVISQWLRTGSISQMENSGTGTRAALAASKEMPNSLVVKVSASGKLMVYKNGNSLDT